MTFGKIVVCFGIAAILLFGIQVVAIKKKWGKINAQGANLPQGVGAPCGVVCKSSLRKEVMQNETQKATHHSLSMLKNR